VIAGGISVIGVTLIAAAGGAMADDTAGGGTTATDRTVPRDRCWPLASYRTGQWLFFCRATGAGNSYNSKSKRRCVDSNLSSLCAIDAHGWRIVTLEEIMPEQIVSWGTQLQNSLVNALALIFSAIPSIVAFLFILGAGWIVATLVARGTAAVLRRVGFNDMAHRSGLAAFITNTGVETDAIGFVALIAKWFIALIALVVAFDALGLPAISETLRQLVLWLPNIVAALVVLIVGGLAANALRGLVRASAASAELGNPDLLGSIARGAVWAFAVVAAVNQVGIASDLLTIMFTALVAAVALAIGLAFGLGARDTAGEIAHELYTRLRSGSEPRIGAKRHSGDPYSVPREH
jgi:hypothetical protein